jgi:FAD/FMN-containing dehydrogenase
MYKVLIVDDEVLVRVGLKTTIDWEAYGFTIVAEASNGEQGYEQARMLYNAMIDRHPALIARCVDAADVIYAVNFARENGVTLAVRGGGHSGPGLGSVDNGLVIDLSRMKGVQVDPAKQTVRVEPGCVWGDVDHATRRQRRLLANAHPAPDVRTPLGVGPLDVDDRDIGL